MEISSRTASLGLHMIECGLEGSEWNGNNNGRHKRINSPYLTAAGWLNYRIITYSDPNKEIGISIP